MSLKNKIAFILVGFLILILTRLFSASFINREARVEIYTLKTCGYCILAKELLEEKGIVYEEYEISQDHDLFDQMVRRTHNRTVPQVIINNRAIGGYTELFKLNETGKLDDLLKSQIN